MGRYLVFLSLQEKRCSLVRGMEKNNYLLFAAVVIALLLCLPLLGTNAGTAKKPDPARMAYDRIENACDKAGLTDLRKMNAGFVFDIRYATTNNFTHTKLYDNPLVFLRKDTAQKLADSNRELMADGYRIKIFDAYRPYSVQKKLFAKVGPDVSFFIANPNKHGSNHNRGCAVDITLVHLDGSPVEMPSGFDSFTEKAYITYAGCSKTAIQDRELLAKVMVKHGFKRLECEWWHFDDTDKAKYGLLDIRF